MKESYYFRQDTAKMMNFEFFQKTSKNNKKLNFFKNNPSSLSKITFFSKKFTNQQIFQKLLLSISLIFFQNNLIFSYKLAKKYEN